MTGLVFDTTGEDCAVGLYRPGESSIFAEHRKVLGRGHAEVLMPMIENLLTENGIGWDELCEVTVATGPGSFAGIRVGVAAARGIALAREIKCFGVSQFDALFQALESYDSAKTKAVIIDARRSEVYAAIKGPNLSTKPVVTTITALSPTLDEHTLVAGSAAPMVKDHGAEFGKSFEVVRDLVAPLLDHIVSARNKIDDDALLASPFYLRAPDAKPQTNRMLVRK